MAKVESFLIFTALMIIPAICYTFAAFYNTVHPSSSIVTAIGIAVMFATVEYIFKVPIISYAKRENVSNTHIQAVWIILTLLLASYSMSFIGGNKEIKE